MKFSKRPASSPLRGRALITGGTSGIGLAFAKALAARGCDLTIVARNRARLDDVSGALARVYGVDCDVLAADLGTDGGVLAVCERLADRPVEVLVNNAGITRDRMFMKMTREEWDAVINTNLSGVFNVTKQVVPDMVAKGWGRIIQISSVNGRKGQAGQTNYSAAKAGMHGFAMALAQELAGKGVTVNSVSPGYVGTDMVNAIRPDVLEKIVAAIPVKRLGTPHEIASIVGWLAGEDSGFTTGANFSCNGGLHME